MTTQQHRIFDLAGSQLQTAVILFIHDQDKFSAITLAGAADTLLCQLLRNKNEETFTNLIQKELGDEEEKQMSLGVFGKKINDMAYINALKHFDDAEEGEVVMDADGCALMAILKALPNFFALGGKNYKFVKEFLAWQKANLDPTIYNVDCDPNWKPTQQDGT